mmetsp:Transcript_59849/g.120127  ORF Transcript_59849/g.120127 Transcript_59849/m.120127 type:complete len:123 (+) Transcript_59849:276-644(+)
MTATLVGTVVNLLLVDDFIPSLGDAPLFRTCGADLNLRRNESSANNPYDPASSGSIIDRLDAQLWGDHRLLNSFVCACQEPNKVKSKKEMREKREVSGALRPGSITMCTTTTIAFSRGFPSA